MCRSADSRLNVRSYLMNGGNVRCYLFNGWIGLLIRYSGCLRIERSGDGIPLGRDFPHLLRLALGAHPASCTMGTRSFWGGKVRPGCDADPSPLLVPRLKYRRTIPLFDRLCGLVVRVSGYRYRGLGFDSRRYQIFLSSSES